MASTVITILSGLAGGFAGTLFYQWLAGQEFDGMRCIFVGSGIAVVGLFRKRLLQGRTE